MFLLTPSARFLPLMVKLVNPDRSFYLVSTQVVFTKF